LRGYDPPALALVVDVVKEITEEGVAVRTVYSTSEVADGFAGRVIAYCAFPTGVRLIPSIVHLHGGPQNATRAYVVYRAKLGYAALSVNWGGRPLKGDEVNGRTDCGPLRYRQNSDNSGNVSNLKPDGHFNSWYHWAIVGRRGLTFLEQQPEVDPARLGLFDISMGGRLAWLIAGTDDRIRCAASVDGAAMMDEPVEGVPNSEYTPATRRSPLWRATLDTYADAPTIRRPFLFFSSENDFFGRFDQVDQPLARNPGPWHWRVLAPHFSHPVSDPEASARPQWMDRWLRDAPVRLIDGFSRRPSDWFATGAGPNVLPPVHAFLRRATGAGEPAIVATDSMDEYWRAFTRKVGDSKWRVSGGTGLAPTDMLVRIRRLGCAGSWTAALGSFALISPYLQFSLRTFERFHHAEKRLLVARGWLPAATVRPVTVDLGEDTAHFLERLLDQLRTLLVDGLRRGRHDFPLVFPTINPMHSTS